MCRFSRDQNFKLASLGDRLILGPSDSPHTGNRWFRSTDDNNEVCVRDKTKLLVQDIIKPISVLGKAKLCVHRIVNKVPAIKPGDILEFRELRSGDGLLGDFVYSELVGLVRVSRVPLNIKFEVVSAAFEANLLEAGKAVAQLPAATMPETVHTR